MSCKFAVINPFSDKLCQKKCNIVPKPFSFFRVFVDQLFGLFDSDKSGSIDFNVSGTTARWYPNKKPLIIKNIAGISCCY